MTCRNPRLAEQAGIPSVKTEKETKSTDIDKMTSLTCRLKNTSVR